MITTSAKQTPLWIAALTAGILMLLTLCSTLGLMGLALSELLAGDEENGLAALLLAAPFGLAFFLAADIDQVRRLLTRLRIACG